MYTIATIIYGLPLHYSGWDDVEYSDELDAAIQWDTEGFHQFYSGSAPQSPTAFGVLLGEFNECSPYVDIASLTILPSIEQVEKYNQLWDSLSEELKIELTTFGVPRSFILWSTS